MREKLVALAVLLLTLPPASQAQTWPGRQPDSLLYRAGLQRIVDLQVERNGHALIELLGDEDPVLRARAAFALGSVQDPAAEQALIQALQDDDARVRADAAFALGQLPSSTASKVLADALTRETNPIVRAELITALGKTGDQESLTRLTAMPLTETDTPVIALAIGRYGIRNVHAPEAVAWLVERLDSPDPAVRVNAAYYFGRSQATEPWAAWSDSVRAALDRLPLSDPAAMHLILGIGRLNDAADTPRLVRWLRDGQDWRIRANAARALAGRADDAPTRSALLKALTDSVHHVVLVAASALADAPTWTTAEVQRVRQWIESRPETHPATASLLRGLARHGQDERYVLDRVRRLHENNGIYYADALAAVAELPGENAFTWLHEAVADDHPQVAYAALEALGARWERERLQQGAAERYFPIFADALRSRDLALTYTAAPLLADSLFLPLGSVSLLTEVYRQLRTPEDIEPMTAILGALAETGDPRATPVLESALQHPHPVVRRAAAEALGRDVSSGSIEVEPPERTVDWVYLRERGPHPRIVLHTEEGIITITLDPEQAPLTVQTLLQLTEQGRFNGVPFHRVVPNFVVQGGDFERRDGFGGPGFAIRSEFTRTPYLRGVAGMASAGKDTEGSQFFITHSMQPHLDGRYTAFGVVTDGMDVVDRLARHDRITKAVVIPDAGTRP